MEKEHNLCNHCRSNSFDFCQFEEELINIDEEASKRKIKPEHLRGRILMTVERYAIVHKCKRAQQSLVNLESSQLNNNQGQNSKS